MLTTRVIDAIMRLCATIGIICPGTYLCTFPEYNLQKPCMAQNISIQVYII